MTTNFGCIGNTIRLAYGGYIDLVDPQPEAINILDIAHALANICRFGGHSPKKYSVAEHSCWCAMQAHHEGLPVGVQLACLLHDAAEAYLGDVVKPLKIFLGDRYETLEDRMDVVISLALSVDLVRTKNDWKRIDQMMLIAERKAFFPDDGVSWEGESTTQPPAFDILLGLPRHPKDQFLLLYDLLGPGQLR